MTPRYAFVGQPKTNGVIERFSRSLKAQRVHGARLQNPRGPPRAIRAGIARTNAARPIRKNGAFSPHALRRHHALAGTPMAA
jgi:transposase InsO family protein